MPNTSDEQRKAPRGKDAPKLNLRPLPPLGEDGQPIDAPGGAQGAGAAEGPGDGHDAAGSPASPSATVRMDPPAPESRRQDGDSGMGDEPRRQPGRPSGRLAQQGGRRGGPTRVGAADARTSWRQAFSNSAEGRRRSAAAAAARAKHQMDVSIDDARGKPQPWAFLSVIGALAMFLLRLVWAAIRLVWELLVVLAVTLVAIGMVGLLGFGYIYVTSIGEMPVIEDFSLIEMPQDSTIYDRDGEVIGVISTSKREPVAFDQIAQCAKDAVVSIEDERFYNHEGVDFFGIARAIFVNFKSWMSGGGVDQGASTITQQYVRNAYKGVGNEVSTKRKLTEMMLAAQLEAKASKDDILNSYLNTIYYGNGCYGIQAASQYYFGKDAADLDYYEAAVLAAVINGPTIYNPATDDGKTNTASRANVILDKMYALGKLGGMTQDELRALKQTDINERIHITEKERVINQPYYYDYVMRDLRDDYTDEQITSGGWQIYTTLSIRDGEAATEVVRSVEDEYGYAGVSAAIADVNVADGSVNAFCGGTDYSVSQFNAAVDGRLQNGSTMKPILYAIMVDQMGYFVTDQVNCDPIDVAGEGEEEHVITSYLNGGMHTIEEGIIRSDNAMAVRCAHLVGMDRMNEMMHACGATHDIDQNVIAIIGGQEQGYTPLEMATVYGTVANLGTKRDIWCIRSITDNYGNTVYEHRGEETRAMGEEAAKQITHSMQEAIRQHGDWYDIPFAKEHPLAAKSGTTDDKTDLWTCAFDRQRSVALWMGGRDAKVEVPTTTPTAAHKLSDYLYAVAGDDPQDPFDEPEYKTPVPGPADGEGVDAYTERLYGHHLQPRIAYAVDEGRHDGEIISVDGVGSLVARGAEVRITVVRNKVTVPDFVALGDPALAYEQADGLVLRFSTRYSTSGSATPTITSQSIKAGELVDHGTPVTIDVSVATPLITQSESQVPYRGSDDLVSLLSSERDSLAAQGDQLSALLAASEEERARLSQELADARTQEHGRVTVPNVKGLTVKEAKQVLTSVDLTVSTSAAETDVVTSTSPSIGSTAEAGSSVRVYAQRPQGGSGSSSSLGSGNGSGSSSSSSGSGNGSSSPSGSGNGSGSQPSSGGSASGGETGDDGHDGEED